MILTPNQRLSKAARDAYDQQRLLLEEKNRWTSVTALPFQSWGITLFHTLMKHAKLPSQYFLNKYQIEILWQNILKQDKGNAVEFSATAIKAWQLCHQWGIHLQDSAFKRQEETQAWQRWALQFHQYLREHQWVDSESALHQVLACHSITVPLPTQILLWGFTTFTPLEKKFLTHLRHHGMTFTEKNFHKIPASCGKKIFETEEEELEALAKWACHKAQSGKVGCVIPQLAAQKNTVIAIFERFVEDKSLINISLGNTLFEYPLIQAAFTGLKLLEEVLSIETITQFLLSPFYEKSFSEFSVRALLDIKLKTRLQPIMAKNSLLNALDNHPLRIFFEKTVPAERTLTFNTWADFFQAHLRFLGWPGERQLSREEFQLMTHWHQLMTQFVSLDLVAEKITFQTALEKLTAISRKILFQPKRSPYAKIDILGMLEAAGLPFDYLWVTGLHENAWPAMGIPNPFLPLSLQRKLNMPHASSTQNLDFCSQITHQLLSCADEIIISCAKNDKESAVRPSALISALPDAPVVLPVLLKIAEKGKIIPSWEILQEDTAAELSIDHLTHYGSEIFKDQRACPFRAFARHRLHAKKIELPQIGIHALIRGNFIHAVLEKIFQTVTTHQALCELSLQALQLLVNKSITAILGKSEADIFSRVEKKRLEALVMSWLEKEKKREPFTVIATEKTIKTLLGKLPLHLRADRIDKCGENYLIIDYKTSKVNFKHVSDLDEPQLPLYCVVSALPVQSVAIAQLRSGDIKWQVFPQQKVFWEKELLTLADEYLQGYAPVKPRYGKQTCQYCDLTPFCRIKDCRGGF